VSTIAEAISGMRTLFSREFIRIQIVDFVGSPGMRVNAPVTPTSRLLMGRERIANVAILHGDIEAQVDELERGVRSVAKTAIRMKVGARSLVERRAGRRANQLPGYRIGSNQRGDVGFGRRHFEQPHARKSVDLVDVVDDAVQLRRLQPQGRSAGRGMTVHAI